MPDTQVIATDIDYTLTDADLRLDILLLRRLERSKHKESKWSW